MRKTAYVLLISTFAALSAAEPALAQKSYRERQFEPFLTRGETTWSLDLGVRQNNTEYNTADPAGANVNFEQTWSDIRTLELQGGVRHLEPADILFIRGGVHAEANMGAGITVDGRSRLSNYAADNRVNETARQTFGSLTGDSINASAAIGYKIHLTGTPGWKARNVVMNREPKSPRKRSYRERYIEQKLNESGPHISVTPLAGYSADQQSYYREDAFNHIPIPALGLGVQNFPTESDYIANWYGPFFGAEAEIRTRKHMLRLRGEYHDLDYYGKEIRHSREDLKKDPSIDHEADGDGVVLNAEYAYALGEDYALTFDAYYRRRQAEDGKWTSYPVNGAETTRPFNEVKEDSQALRVGVRYNWD